MAPCCLAAEFATAVTTFLAVAVLSALVLVTDAVGLALLSLSALAAALPRLDLAAPRPGLVYILSALLAARAAWLLATSRRPLVRAAWKSARRLAARGLSVRAMCGTALTSMKLSSIAGNSPGCRCFDHRRSSLHN
jgi:hypothetical protein